MKSSVWLPPVLVAAGLAVIGWMLRYILTSIIDKLDSLDATFARVTGQLASEHQQFVRDLKTLEGRVIRLESWRDLLEVIEGHGHGD